jgi:hypothetical protein
MLLLLLLVQKFTRRRLKFTRHPFFLALAPTHTHRAGVHKFRHFTEGSSSSKKLI